MLFPREIQDVQPDSQDGIWNRMEYRGLEGFVFVTPFNFTAIAANLCAAPALMGVCGGMKPAVPSLQRASHHGSLQTAGLPDGVINMVTCDGPVAGDVMLNTLTLLDCISQVRRVFSVICGQQLAKTSRSTKLPTHCWRNRCKDFVWPIPHRCGRSRYGLVRGAFGFGSVQCSISRLPKNLWPPSKSELLKLAN